MHSSSRNAPGSLGLHTYEYDTSIRNVRMAGQRKSALPAQTDETNPNPIRGCRRAPAGSAAPGTRRGCARRRRTPASARPPCRRTARTARPPRPVPRCAAAAPASRPPPGRACQVVNGSFSRQFSPKTLQALAQTQESSFGAGVSAFKQPHETCPGKLLQPTLFK